MSEAVVRLVGGSNELAVEVLGRAHPGGLAVFDHNWLLARVAVRSPDLSFRFDAFLRATDFADFRAELADLASGCATRATYWPTSPWVGMRVAAAGNGSRAYGCEVYARDGGSERAVGFDVELDAADLQCFMQEIDAVVRAFPVVAP